MTFDPWVNLQSHEWHTGTQRGQMALIDSTALPLQTFAHPFVLDKTVGLSIEYDIWAETPYVEITFAARRRHCVQGCCGHDHVVEMRQSKFPEKIHK